MGLNDILNILWRHRGLILGMTLAGGVAGFAYGQIVTPLYLATNTVQPGISTFTVQGQPEREWRIHDIVQWYRRGDFNPAVANLLQKDPTEFLPIIRASYVPRGPQSRGGNTVTLSTLSPGPQEAVDILNASVDAFNNFAGSDTTFSSIHLMRVRVQANIQKQHAKIAEMEAKRGTIDLQIAAAEQSRQITLAGARIVQDQIDEQVASRALIDGSILAYESMIENARASVGALEHRLTRWEANEGTVLAQRDSLLANNRGADTMTTLLYTNSISSLVRDIGELRLGLIDESGKILQWEGEIQRLRERKTGIDRRMSELRFEKKEIVPQKALEFEQEAAKLRLQREFELAREEQDHRQELRNMKVRLASLTPLEKIGAPTATARPIRPRKRRAIQILALLGLASSIFASFGLEYLRRNWQDITRSRTA